MNLSSIVRHSPRVRFRVLDGEAVVIQQEANEVVGLNPVGTRLFSLIDGPTPVTMLVDELSAEFEVEREAVVGDVLAFLDELAGAGLVVEEPSRNEEQDP